MTTASHDRMQKLTLRMLGQNTTLARCAWEELLDELRPDADLAKRIRELLELPSPPEPKEAKAKRLRVGYGVWAEGAPAPARIHNIRREDPDYPGKIVAFVAWGRLVYEPDELVKVDAPVLHPQIVDSTGTELGLGSGIAGGKDADGEVVEIIEPDESQWLVAVQWPEFDEPETFEACSDPRSGYESEPLFASDIATTA